MTALLRELAPQVLGAIVRRYRDFAACEDAVQEALLAAATQWPREGVPENPRGWLIHVAARRMVDQVRSEVARRAREEYVVSLVPADEQLAAAADVPEEQEDTLRLMALCCHPALSSTSAIALTLRAIGGLTTTEIAAAFFVPEATMAQRISRAKQTVREAGFTALGSLANVAHVLYLMFNEGYAASGGPSLVRTDLSNEAIRLTRLLKRALPGEPEVNGLLALMLLTDARRAARTGAMGELIPLDKQDRSLWDRALIAEGDALLATAFSPGYYQVQAAIASLHDEASSTETTDWPQILALYDVLRAIADSPVLALNEAVAFAMVHGPRAGLARIDTIAGLEGNHRLDAVRAHLLERAGDRAAAIKAYVRAGERTTSIAERNYLFSQAGRLR